MKKKSNFHEIDENNIMIFLYFSRKYYLFNEKEMSDPCPLLHNDNLITFRKKKKKNKKKKIK